MVKWLVRCLVLTGFICLVSGASADDAGRPNILLICIDTLRADQLGAYGAGRGSSPSLDGFAAEGVVFDQAVSVSSWTKPSVVSLLTGLYPSEHGVLRASRKRVDVLAPRFETLAERLASAGYVTAAFVQNDHLQKRSSGLDQGFGTYFEEAGVAPILSNRFLSWLEGEQRKPFFAYLHFLDPHWPYTPDSIAGGGQGSDADAMRIAHWGLRTEHWWLLRDRVNKGKLGDLDAAEVRTLAKLYAGEVHEIDAVLGRLFRLLRSDGVFDNTLVVVTSDHGEGFLEHKSLDHGYGLYDELLRVPLLIRFPAGKYRGHRVSALVQSIDVVPTLLEVAGVDVHGHVAGRSLVGAAAGKAGVDREFAYSEEVHGRTRTLSVRARDRKYIRTTSPGRSYVKPRQSVPPDLKPGVRVQAEGIFVGGQIIAAQVKKVGGGDVDCEVAAPLDVISAQTNRFRLLDFEGTLPKIEAENLAWVRAEGDLENGRLHFRKMRQLFDPGTQEVEVEGIVSAVGDAQGGDITLELCGRRVVVDPGAKWERFERAPSVEAAETSTAEPPDRVVEELYDLGGDATEQTNVAETDEAWLKKLRAVADQWETSVKNGEDSGSGAVLDSATRERLRALGYLE